MLTGLSYRIFLQFTHLKCAQLYLFFLKRQDDIGDNVNFSQVPEVLQNDGVRCSSALEHSAGEGGRISQSSPPASVPGRIDLLLILHAQNISRKEYTAMMMFFLKKIRGFHGYVVEKSNSKTLL